MEKKSNNLIYIVAIDHNLSSLKNSNYSKYCIKTWEYWCKKNNVDLIVNKTHDERFGRPTWNKELIYEIGKKYDKIGVIDSDTMIRWDTPNIFNQFTNEFCGVNDIADCNWVLNSLKEARDDESWDLVKEVISYIEEYEEFADDDIDQWAEKIDYDD